MHYGWLQQPAKYTTCSTVAGLGTWQTGNVWFQLHCSSRAFWLLQIDQAQNFLPDFHATLEALQKSIGGALTLQVGWVLDQTQRAVVVDVLVTTRSCPQ